MKNILFLILLICSISVSAQTTTGTTTQSAALKAFEDAFLTTDWAAKTITEQDAFNRTWTGLKIAAAKEAETNRIATIAEKTAAEQSAQTAATTAKNEFIAKLKSLGYLCDNSQTDWNKLYNRPEMFSSTWQVTADYQHSISTGIDYFLLKAQEILFIRYEIGKYYKIGDTFIYVGEYYKVIQAHTSQRDWVPSTTASLYVKVVAQTTSNWTIGVSYKINEVVVYSGSNYKCLQAHTSQAGWTPIAVPALWQKL